MADILPAWEVVPQTLPPIRIGPEMRRYVAGRLASAPAEGIPVLAIDARTGAPVSTSLTPDQARRLLAAQSPAAGDLQTTGRIAHS